MSKFQLSDDGTPDTVVECVDCGRELWYNFDGGAEGITYDDFVTFALLNAEDEHDCEEDSDG